MSKMRRLTNEEIDELLKMYTEGKSYEEIANAFKIHPQTVGYRVSRSAREGKIKLRDFPKHQARGVSQPKKKKVVKEDGPKVMHQGEVCDAKFCRHCIYHSTDYGKCYCNYAEITQKTRVNRFHNAYKGNMWECREYVRIDADHPLLHSKLDTLTL